MDRGLGRSFMLGQSCFAGSDYRSRFEPSRCRSDFRRCFQRRLATSECRLRTFILRKRLELLRDANQVQKQAGRAVLQ